MSVYTFWTLVTVREGVWRMPRWSLSVSSAVRVMVDGSAVSGSPNNSENQWPPNITWHNKAKVVSTTQGYEVQRSPTAQDAFQPIPGLRWPGDGDCYLMHRIQSGITQDTWGALSLSYDNQKTTSPHSPLYATAQVVHSDIQSATQFFSMCHQNSARHQPENSVIPLTYAVYIEDKSA